MMMNNEKENNNRKPWACKIKNKIAELVQHKKKKTQKEQNQNCCHWLLFVFLFFLSFWYNLSTIHHEDRQRARSKPKERANKHKFVTNLRAPPRTGAPENFRKNPILCRNIVRNHGYQTNFWKIHIFQKFLGKICANFVLQASETRQR